MKLATYKDGSRDGQLVVVSRDLSTAHYATGIATRLQQVLDDWNFLAPQLQDLCTTLNQGKARHAFPFDPRLCMAPLPRAYQWVGSSAYLGHARQLRPACSSQLPVPDPQDPLMVARCGDHLMGPCDPVRLPSEDHGIDCEAEIAVITGDVPMGATPEQALDGVRLLLLACSVHLRHLRAAEQALGSGGLQSQPVSAFSPVAVTPDELGQAWRGGRVHLALHSTWNARALGWCDAGADMGFHFGQLMAHMARTRAVHAGSIVGSGAVSHPGPAVNGLPTWPQGHSCVADQRAAEALLDGRPSTAFMRLGDTWRMEMKGLDGQSLFGAIDLSLVPSAP